MRDHNTPKEEGYYWFRPSKYEEARVVYINFDGYVCDMYDGEYIEHLNAVGDWSEKIQNPED